MDGAAVDVQNEVVKVAIPPQVVGAAVLTLLQLFQSSQSDQPALELAVLLLAAGVLAHEVTVVVEARVVHVDCPATVQQGVVL